jgi:hypothetical protein
MGAIPRRLRKIVWAGKLIRAMTFANAYRELKGARFQKMRKWKYSPIHARPLEDRDRFVGYEHFNLEHAKDDAWISDLVSSTRSRAVVQRGNQLILRAGFTPWTAFNRDACFLLENVFFARGNGIAIDSESVRILKRVHTRSDMDSFAIFGYRKDGSADGLTGRYLTISGRWRNSSWAGF